MLHISLVNLTQIIYSNKIGYYQKRSADTPSHIQNVFANVSSTPPVLIFKMKKIVI